MASRDGAVHVATTRRVYKGKTYESHLLRRSYREGGKVLHETVGNLSHLPAETIDLIRRSLRGEHFVAAEDRLEIVRSLPHGHVAAVLGALRATGLDTLLDRAASRERERGTRTARPHRTRVARIKRPIRREATQNQPLVSGASRNFG